MEHASDSRVVIIFSGNEKKDLLKRFDELTDQFRNEKINGSIQLHFSQGYLAKIHTVIVD